MKTNFKIWLFPLAILVLAFSLRFYQLGNIPVELNRDEASLGYNAYSILKTRKEEHGVAWPINVESFGDWKLPGYIYTLVPFVQIFGLSPWSVRLPSALAGIGTVILIAALTWQLTTRWKNQSHRSLFVCLSSLLVAISPWSIHLSHLAYEANLAMFFFLAGINLFLYSVGDSANKQAKTFSLPLSVFFFGSTLFTYHSYQIFTPLMAITLLVVFRSAITKIFQHHKPSFWIAFLLATFFSVTLIATSLAANKVKFSGLSIFDKSAYSETIWTNRGYFADRNGLLAKVYTNTVTVIVNQLQRNIGAIFSSKFLFFEGGTHGAHDIAGTGKLFPISFILLSLAGYNFIKSHLNGGLKKWQTLLLSWLGIAVIAPIITFEAAHSIRFSPALPALEIMASYGLSTILFNKRKWSLLMAALVGLILTYSLAFFCLTYFVIAPQRDLDKHNWQIKQLINLINEHQANFDTIHLPGANWSPYIYFLFYNQYDPTVLAENIEFYPVDWEGFKHVKKLGKIDFSPVDWETMTPDKILYVIKKSEIPEDKFNSAQYEQIYSLTLTGAKDEWIFLAKK